MALTKVTPSMFEGSTGGGGAENFITDNQASFAISSFTTAKYTAGTRPPATLTSSGSPAITSGFSTSNPLYKDRNFELVKPASNCQGEAYEYAFEIPYFASINPAIQQIELPFRVASGTFTAGTDTTDSDVICYIAYNDAGTWKPLEPSDFKFRSNTVDKFRGAFQTLIGVTQYKLMLYVASNTTNAFTLHMDKISVGPQSAAANATIETASTLYNPTAYSGGLNAITFSTGSGHVAPNGNWRRAGKYLKGKVGFRNGTGGSATGTSGTLIIPTPNNLGWDVNLVVSDGAIGPTIGTAQIYSSSGYSGKENVIVQVVSGVVCFQIQKSATAWYWALSDITAGFSIQIDFDVPIAGWDTVTRISDGYDGRQIATKVYGNPAASAANSIIIFPSVEFDKTASYNTTTGQYKVPRGGILKIGGYVEGSTSGNSIWVWVNGVQKDIIGYLTNGATGCSLSGYIEVVAGQLIDLRAYSSIDVSYAIVTFEMQSTPVVAASETVSASYWLGADSTSNQTTPINFGSKEYDTHNAVTTGSGWKFNAPIAGFYRISGYLQQGTSVTSTLRLYKNGAYYKNVNRPNSTVSSTPISIEIQLNAQETFDLRTDISTHWIGGANMATEYVGHISISKL